VQIIKLKDVDALVAQEARFFLSKPIGKEDHAAQCSPSDPIA
jgi:hypothetical protein